jgi:hypothetical protein
MSAPKGHYPAKEKPVYDQAKTVFFCFQLLLLVPNPPKCILQIYSIAYNKEVMQERKQKRFFVKTPLALLRADIIYKLFYIYLALRTFLINVMGS